jgi:hypothetical protein
MAGMPKDCRSNPGPVPDAGWRKRGFFTSLAKRAGVRSARAGDDTMLNPTPQEILMYNIVYIIGAIVIVVAILSFLGLR